MRPAAQNTFSVTSEDCKTGFQYHVYLKPSVDPTFQLQRQKLHTRAGISADLSADLIKIIDKNSSLRISFGWSFESIDHIKIIMSECLDHLSPRFASLRANITTDMHGDWIGFLPYNAFEREIYESLSSHDLITFNNELCELQIDVVRFIQNHKIYKQHLLLRDRHYRYNLFKNIRRDPDKLSESFRLVMEALQGTLNLPRYPRHEIEEIIGCHFLYHPDIFFELLDFYILKGTIHE